MIIEELAYKCQDRLDMKEKLEERIKELEKEREEERKKFDEAAQKSEAENKALRVREGRQSGNQTSASKGSCWPARVTIAQNSRCQYGLKDLMASAAPRASSKLRAWALTLLTAIHGE